MTRARLFKGNSLPSGFLGPRLSVAIVHLMKGFPFLSVDLSGDLIKLPQMVKRAKELLRAEVENACAIAQNVNTQITRRSGKGTTDSRNGSAAS